MLSELNLPNLPKGFRWRFYINCIGSPKLVLEKHIAFGQYSEIGYDLPELTVKYSGGTIEEAIQAGAEKIYKDKQRWFTKPDVSEYTKYVGTTN